MCEKNNQIALDSNRSSSSRLSIWSIHKRFHCSIIGTCLSIKELQQIGKKLGLKKSLLDKPFQLHGAFVSLSGTRSHEARVIDKHLNRKYQRTIQIFKQARDQNEISILWQKAIEDGDVAASFWALATHPKCLGNLLMDAYGQVHMLSHLCGEPIRLDMPRLAKLQRKLPELELKLKTQEKKFRQSLAKKEATIQQLKTLITSLKSSDSQRKLEKLEQTKESVSSLSNSEQLAKQLLASQIIIERSSKEAEQWKAIAQEREERCQFLEAHQNKLVTEQSTMERSMSNLLSINQTPDCLNNEAIDLCNRCILYVGGRNRQCAHFRELVEQLNGRFLHHDGGVEESSQRLTSMVSKSDAVLCPLDSISHNAMNLIKRDCKNQGKSLQFLRQSSLATFTHGLHLVASNSRAT